MRMITLMLAIALVSSAQAEQIPGLQPPQLGKIELSAGALTLQGDIYSAVITAKLTDTEGKPFTGANVYFNSSKGNLNTSFGLYPQGWLNITDSNGKTEAVLTLASLESVTVTANSGNINATITVSAPQLQLSVSVSPTIVTVGTPTHVIADVTSGGTSIAGAAVSLSGAGVSKSNATESDGTAHFYNVAAISAGTITINASKAGYTSNSTTIRASLLSPQVAAYDFDNNNDIDKGEAVQAVLDYFDNKISKAQAVDVVLAYFS